MRFHPTRILVVAALCLTLGLHWTALQSAAWAGMVVKHCRSGTFAEALVKTFDGKHPCALCKVVRASKGAEKKADVSTPAAKLDFHFQTVLLKIHPPAAATLSGGQSGSLSSRGETPPTPPPRPA